MSRASRPSMVAGAAVARIAAARVLGRVLARAEGDGRPLVEVVGETLFHERERLARHGASARTSDDRAFVEGLGRALPRGARLPLGPVTRLLGEVLAELRRREAEGRVTRGVELSGDASQVLERALRVFATYHELPVLRRDGAELVVGDASLLYFYRNRLAHLGLVGAPSLLPDDGA